jgi:hypothetical protein
MFTNAGISSAHTSVPLSLLDFETRSVRVMMHATGIMFILPGLKPFKLSNQTAPTRGITSSLSNLTKPSHFKLLVTGWFEKPVETVLNG